MRFTFGLATLLGIAIMLVGCDTTKSDKSETKSNKAETPPFIIFHGLDDGVVPASQSELLSRRLDQFGVPNELFLVKGKRHGDPVFDTDEFVSKVVNFVKGVNKKNN